MSGDKPMRVSDIMSADVHSVDGLATVAEAMALMRRHGISSLVVSRRDADDEFGLLVVSDIAAQVVAANRAPERMHVYEVMSKPVLTLPSAMLARYATPAAGSPWPVAGDCCRSRAKFAWHGHPARPSAGRWLLVFLIAGQGFQLSQLLRPTPCAVSGPPALSLV